MLVSNEYTIRPYLAYPYKMTFILGSRCKDGVVLIADRKITSTNEFGSISFDYKNKLYGILDGVIFGSSGSTDTFELFWDHTFEEVRKNKDVTYDNVIIRLCDIVLDINKKRDFMKEHYFELLVAIRHPDKPSTLSYITGVGANVR